MSQSKLKNESKQINSAIHSSALNSNVGEPEGVCNFILINNNT